MFAGKEMQQHKNQSSTHRKISWGSDKRLEVSSTMGKKKKLSSGLSYPEEPTPTTFLTSLDFLVSKKDRAHAAVLMQLIKLE